PMIVTQAVKWHFRRYFTVRIAFLALTPDTRPLLCEFRHAKSKRGRRSPRRHLQSRARCRHLHALVGGKAPDLPRPHFHRFLCLWTFLAHLPCLVRPRSPLMSIKGFHIVFIVFSTLLALGIGCYCVWVDLTVGEQVYRTGAIA